MTEFLFIYLCKCLLHGQQLPPKVLWKTCCCGDHGSFGLRRWSWRSPVTAQGVNVGKEFAWFQPSHSFLLCTFWCLMAMGFITICSSGWEHLVAFDLKLSIFLFVQREAFWLITWMICYTDIWGKTVKTLFSQF